MRYVKKLKMNPKLWAWNIGGMNPGVPVPGGRRESQGRADLGRDGLRLDRPNGSGCGTLGWNTPCIAILKIWEFFKLSWTKIWGSSAREGGRNPEVWWDISRRMARRERCTQNTGLGFSKTEAAEGLCGWWEMTEPRGKGHFKDGPRKKRTKNPYK